jgi:hypothetical protein
MIEFERPAVFPASDHLRPIPAAIPSFQLAARERPQRTAGEGPARAERDPLALAHARGVGVVTRAPGVCIHPAPGHAPPGEGYYAPPTPLSIPFSPSCASCGMGRARSRARSSSALMFAYGLGVACSSADPTNVVCCGRPNPDQPTRTPPPPASLCSPPITKDGKHVIDQFLPVPGLLADPAHQTLRPDTGVSGNAFGNGPLLWQHASS